MNDDQFANPGLKKGASGMPERHRVELSIGLADFETGGFARFDFIENTIIDVFQSGRDHPAKAVAVLADDIDAGLEAGLLGAGEETGGFGSKTGVRLIERVEEEQVAKMENRGFGLGKIEVFTFPKSIRAAVVEKGSSAISLFRHDIGVGSIGVG